MIWSSAAASAVTADELSARSTMPTCATPEALLPMPLTKIWFGAQPEATASVLVRAAASG